MSGATGGGGSGTAQLIIGGDMRRSHLVLVAATTFTIIFLRASERPAHAQQTPPF